MDFTNAAISVLIVVLSAIPLNIAIKLMGGESSLLRVIGANFLIAFMGVILGLYFGKAVGWILSFGVLLLVYKLTYDLSWLRALLAWMLQFVIATAILYVLAVVGFKVPFL